MSVDASEGTEGAPPVARIASRLKADARLARDGVEIVVAGSVAEVRRREGLAVIVPSSALRDGALAPYLERLAEMRAALLLCGEQAASIVASLPSGVVVSLVDDPCSNEALYHALGGLLDRLELKQHDERKMKSINRYRYELGELVEIARALSQERDIGRLLGLILEKSRFITGADAGSIYVVEDTQGSRQAAAAGPGGVRAVGAGGPRTSKEGQDPEQRLRFKLSQNDSCAFESSEFTVPISTRSIAGAAAVTRKPINLDDVYRIPSGAPYGFDRSFDEKVGYRTRSMIAVPMISAEDEVIGVIQLINKKKTPEKKLTTENVEHEVIPFDARAEEVLRTLSSQAGIALENALLYDEIKRIFEGFVRASVQAIEQRDPTTSGHSLRVSVLSCRLAEVVDRVDVGPYATETFTRRQVKELEYASLLHDFGKIGVREKVLVKAKKLYPHELDAIRARFEVLMQRAEAEAYKRKLEVAQAGGGASDLAAVDLDLEKRRGELSGALAVILQANEPTVLNEGDFAAIGLIGSRTYVDAHGCERPLLTSEEVASLQVTRGSLNVEEIDEIRSHVVHTYNFLSSIPWGKTMKNIPLIAGAHHEKLNGTGYPNAFGATQIPLQSKIMTIADIFDALTARDRPYKKAVPLERALAILGFEVKDQHVDPELYRLFTEAKVYEVVQQDLSY